MALLDLADQRLDDRGAVSDVLRELFALALTHLVEAVAGLGKYGQNVLRQLVRVLLDALRAEHIGELCEAHDGHIVAQAVLFGQLAQRRQIALCERVVYRDGKIAALVGLDADIDLGLAACDARGGRLLHGVIQKAELARRLYRAVQIAVVDSAQLDGNGASMQHLSRAAVAGHTLHFISSPSGKSM